MRKAALLLLPVCLALAACGGGYSSSSSGNAGATTAAAASARTVSISESEFKLSPGTLSVAKPGKVTFDVKNVGTVTHALEIEGNGVETKTGSIAPGQAASITVTLSKAGKYELYCPIDGHRDKGMEGAVQVGGSSGGMTTEGTTTTMGSGY
jgi:uncharacterized cupredoxin-like copper-binding protein